MLENVVNKIPLSLTTQTLILGLTVGVIAYKVLGKKYKLPPGPRGPPLIGNLLSLNSSVPLYKMLMEWKTKFGPAVTVYLGPIPIVTLNGVDVVNEALVKKSADYAGRPQSYSVDKLSDGYKDIILSDVSPQWKLLRKLAHQGLRQYLTGTKLEDKLFESAVKVMKILKDTEGTIIDVEKYVSLLVFNLLQGVCFNKSFDIDDKIFLQTLNNIDVVNKNFGNGVWEDIIPPLRKFPTKRFRLIVDNFTEFLDFIFEECRQHRENFNEDDLKDFTDFMINARKQAILEDPTVEGLITDDHICHTVSDIFAAGVDTTRQTITWTIFLLVKNPEILKKLHAELDQVLEIGQAPTIADREKLPYTEAVLHESMRMCPVAPMGVPHCTRCDTTLGEYEIPKGTTVIINHWALHNDPDVWDQPDVFKPERFLDEDGQLAPKSMSWLPFSAGRRNCLGESIARPEMHLLLAVLMRNFTFKSPHGKTVDLSPGGSLAMIPPKNDLIAVLRK